MKAAVAYSAPMYASAAPTVAVPPTKAPLQATALLAAKSALAIAASIPSASIAALANVNKPRPSVPAPPEVNAVVTTRLAEVMYDPAGMNASFAVGATCEVPSLVASGISTTRTLVAA